MLVVHRSKGTWEDRMFREVSQFLSAGDCLIMNNTRVFPSRLFGVRCSGTARVEVFLVRALADDQLTWQVLVRPGRKLPVGERIHFSDKLQCEILARADHGARTVRFDAHGDFFDLLNELGHMPLPPY